MNLIPSHEFPSNPPLHSIPQTDEQAETLQHFSPFFTQQIIEKMTHSIIFPTLHFTYTSSRKLIMACKVICTVQNIVTHPVQSIAAGVFLYSDPYGTRNLAIQGALAVIAVSAIDDYLHHLNGLAALKNFSSKTMKTSESLGACQTSSLPLLGYAEKTAILLSREIFYFSRSLNRVLITPDQFRRDVDKICQIAREELIDSLTLPPKEQFPVAMPVPRGQSPLPQIESPKDETSNSIIDGSIHGESDIKKSTSYSHIEQLTSYAASGMEFFTDKLPNLANDLTSSTQDLEQSSMESPTATGINSYWSSALGGVTYVSSLAFSGLAKSKELLSAQSTPATQVPSSNPIKSISSPLPPISPDDDQKSPPPAPTSESTLPIHPAQVNENAEASPPENHRLDYFSFLTSGVKHGFESVTYYAKEGVNAALNVSSSGLSSTLNGILLTKDYAIDGVSKTMASAYSLGEKIICSAGTKALTYASERMLKNVKSAAAKELETAEILLANNIIARIAHISFSTMISGGTQLILPYFFFRQIIVMLPLPYEEEEQNRLAHTTAAVVTVVGNLIWMKSILPSAKHLDHFYKMKFEREKSKYFPECMQLVPDELRSLMQEHTINLKVLQGIDADYTFYAKKIGLNVERYQRRFIKKINQEQIIAGLYIPSSSSMQPGPNSYSTASTVTVEEIHDSTELLILGSSPSKIQ